MADVLWALALAHHWTPRMPKLEPLLVDCGGLASCTPREATSALWAFATLGHTPTGTAAPAPPTPGVVNGVHGCLGRDDCAMWFQPYRATCLVVNLLRQMCWKVHVVN